MSIISTINSPNWLPHCGKYLCSLLMRNMMPAVFYCQRDCLKLRRIKLELSKYVVKTENSWFCLFNIFFHLFFIFIWGHLKFMPGFGPHYSVYWQVLYRPLCWEGSRQFMAGYLCMINLEVVSKDVLGFCLKKKKKEWKGKQSDYVPLPCVTTFSHVNRSSKIATECSDKNGF